MTTTNNNVSTADRLTICDLYHRFNWSLDCGDGQAFAECFANDGDLTQDEQQIVGQNALREWAHQRSANRTKTRHWTGNLLIARGSKGATSASYGLRIDIVNESPPAITSTTISTDDLVLDAGVWKFTRRHIQSD